MLVRASGDISAHVGRKDVVVFHKDGDLASLGAAWVADEANDIAGANGTLHHRELFFCELLRDVGCNLECGTIRVDGNEDHLTHVANGHDTSGDLQGAGLVPLAIRNVIELVSYLPAREGLVEGEVAVVGDESPRRQGAKAVGCGVG